MNLKQIQEKVDTVCRAVLITFLIIALLVVLFLFDFLQTFAGLGPVLAAIAVLVFLIWGLWP